MTFRRPPAVPYPWRMTSERTSRAERAAVIALALTIVLGLAKMAVWAATSSLAVLSQALDSILDVVALVLVLLAVRIAVRPADASHHYGHAKAENLAAFTQTIILGIVVLGVAFEAVLRLMGEEDIATPWYSFALLGVSAIVDVFRVRMLRSAAAEEDSDALRAGALNFATDIATALVALSSLAFVRAGFDKADAIGGLLVAVAVAAAAIRLGKRSVDVLMDRAPEATVQTISDAAAGAEGVTQTRRVRVRTSGHQLFADVTVAAGRTYSLERAHDISEAVEKEIERVLPGADVVVHIEPMTEESGLVERVHAAASRVPGAQEVHNVNVHAFNEGRGDQLHVTLHAKVAYGTSLVDAHDLSERIESAVAKELAERNESLEVRVDTHIEPLDPTLLGADVTVGRADVVATVKAATLEEADMRDCHEVIVTETGSEISVVAHVKAAGGLPLTRIHDASNRIEKRIHAAHPEVGSVLFHFEPS